jgi:hypothetical protein
MNKTIILLAAGGLAGAALVYMAPKKSEKVTDLAESEPSSTILETPAPARHVEPARDSKPLPVQPPSIRVAEAPKAAPHPSSAWARLAEKYGPEKTCLSSKVTSNITSVIHDGVNLANTWAKNTGSGSVAEAATKEIMRNATTQLGLNETQQQQASGLIQSVIERRMNAITDLTSAMSSEPEQMMDMLLAGDALARNEITQAQYDQMTLPTRTMLRNIGNFMTGQSGSGGLAQLMGDQATADQLNAILTPEQQTKLADFATQMTERAQARQQRGNNSGMPFQMGQIPVMELDKLDQSVASMQKMTEAARLMMEGMKGLKDANPSVTKP